MLDRIVAGMNLVLHDIAGERRIDTIDPDRICADLRAAGTPARLLVWFGLQSLQQFDRILLVRDKHAGTCEGVFLVRHRQTETTPFLAIEAIGAGPLQRQHAMYKRMLGYLILRLGTLDQRPVAILADTRNPTLCRALHEATGQIGGAGFYPQPDDGPIVLATAALAHRAAREAGATCHFAAARLALQADAAEQDGDGMLSAMLDLRDIDEATLDEAARHMLRDRLPRAAMRGRVAAVLPMQGAARRRDADIPTHVTVFRR